MKISNNKKNVTHIAWLGNDNFGDVLMAEAVEKKIREIFDINTYTFWCDYKPIMRHGEKWIYQHDILHKKYLSTILENNTLRKTDILIIGGGSVLHSVNSSAWKLRGIKFMKQHNKHSRAIGIGLSVGPFYNQEEETKAIELLKNLDACAVRDQRSYDFISQIKDINYEPILAADLAATIFSSADQNPKKKTIETIGITVREAYKCDPEKTFQNYVSLVKKCEKQYKKIIIFCFSRGKENEELNFCKKILTQAKINNGEIVQFTTIDNFIKRIKECDFIFSTKLHGSVLSFLFNIPFANIVYHQKIIDFLDYIGYPKKLCFDQNNFNPDVMLDALYIKYCDNQNQYRQNAMKNFKVFDKIY